MPEDTKQQATKAEPPQQVGKQYRGDAAVFRTPEQAAATQSKQAEYAKKPGAMPIQAYFAAEGFLSDPILMASMLAYTEIRTATKEDFDAIFLDHHTTPQHRAEEAAKQAKVEEEKAAAEKAAAEKAVTTPKAT